MRGTVCSNSSCVACEKLRRKTSTPAAMACRRCSSEATAGPSVATILVWRGNPFMRIDDSPPRFPSGTTYRDIRPLPGCPCLRYAVCMTDPLARPIDSVYGWQAHPSTAPMTRARTFENIGLLEILDAPKPGKQATATKALLSRISRRPNGMAGLRVNRRSRVPDFGGVGILDARRTPSTPVNLGWAKDVVKLRTRGRFPTWSRMLRVRCAMIRVRPRWASFPHHQDIHGGRAHV